MINLNDNSFDAKEGKAIFNDGEAGVVNNVTLSVKKKTPEDKEKAPDFKLTFTSENGASTDMGFYYATQDTTFTNGNTLTLEDQIKKQGTILKHVIHAIYGADFQLPTFTSGTDMLNGCMKLIREGVASGLKFRAFANFGSTQAVKKYVQIRSWVPFIEPMSVSITETRLTAGKIDAMVGLEADNVGTTSSAQGTAVANTDDW
jgi:hypothetical protein